MLWREYSFSNSRQEKSVNLDELLQELTTVYEKSDLNEDVTVWTNSSSEEIIQHVIEHYHRPLDEELQSLSPYVTKVSRVHGERHPELLEVFELFSELKQELLEHTAKEEATSFPLILTLDLILILKIKMRSLKRFVSLKKSMIMLEIF